MHFTHNNVRKWRNWTKRHLKVVELNGQCPNSAYKAISFPFLRQSTPIAYMSQCNVLRFNKHLTDIESMSMPGTLAPLSFTPELKRNSTELFRLKRPLKSRNSDNFGLHLYAVWLFFSLIRKGFLFGFNDPWIL